MFNLISVGIIITVGFFRFSRDFITVREKQRSPIQIIKKGKDSNKDFHFLANISRLAPPFMSGRLPSDLQVSQFTVMHLPAA